MIDWKEKYPEYVSPSGQMRRNAPQEVKTNIFIIRAKNVHENRYNYDNSVYAGADSKLSILCTVHGEFMQTPGNHIKGKGCPKCAGKDQTTEDFIAKAISTHGSTYDYSRAVYISTKTHVEIICRTHGAFLQVPDAHIGLRQGCPKCYGNSRSSTEDFSSKSSKVHSNKYTYEQVEYTSAHRKVNITCLEHGIFSQTPHNHLQGNGCPSCANRDFGFIYMIDYHEIGIKVGITNNINKRFLRLSSNSPVPIKLIAYWQTNNAREIEKLVHQSFSKASIAEVFDGYTEIVLGTEKEIKEFINASI